MMSLGKRIRDERIKKSLTQDELGELIGKTRANVSNYEQDVNSPPADILIKLADIFNVSVDYLLGRVDMPNKRVEGLEPEDQQLLKGFLMRSEEMLREKGSLSEEKLRQVLRFMEFTFLEDLEEEKKKRK